MFTLNQIKEIHAKVKTGADFPAYIGELKTIGVTGYETYVGDGHTSYHGKGGKVLDSASRYDPLTIVTRVDPEQFKKDLKKHQDGGSDYNRFVAECAANGIEKWTINMERMTCIYYDRAGNQILVEQIPGV